MYVCMYVLRGVATDCMKFFFLYIILEAENVPASFPSSTGVLERIQAKGMHIPPWSCLGEHVILSFSLRSPSLFFSFLFKHKVVFLRQTHSTNLKDRFRCSIALYRVLCLIFVFLKVRLDGGRWSCFMDACFALYLLKEKRGYGFVVLVLYTAR